MHYIVGTNFTVGRKKNIVLDSNNASSTRYERQLNAGCNYVIINIRKEEDKLVYKLRENTGKILELSFNSAREADILIASFRNELIQA
jgi:hypothetical protein